MKWNVSLISIDCIIYLDFLLRLHAEFLLCDGQMHYRVISVYSPVRWHRFCHSYTGVLGHIRNVKSISCLHFCRDIQHFVPFSFCYILFYTSNTAVKEPTYFGKRKRNRNVFTANRSKSKMFSRHFSFNTFVGFVNRDFPGLSFK